MIQKGVKYVDEFRDRGLVMKLSGAIKKSARREYVFMEVCGGHTAAIHRFGIPSLLPAETRLISGPGCPVCVTSTDFIDKAIEYSRKQNIILASFGDLLRVPGSYSSLEKEKSSGADVRIVFSGLEALDIAKQNPGKKVVFIGIGFETTAPGTAVTVLKAAEDKTENFLLLSSHKVMPPAMTEIIKDGTKIDGFICPGHVAAITGSDDFRFIPENYGLGCVVTGFEPVDLLRSVLMLIRQVNDYSPAVEIEYTRVVTPQGNIRARQKMMEVFEYCDASWRGFGVIPGSGLRLRPGFQQFDAELVMPVRVDASEENPHCRCGNILRGINSPDDCPLFGGLCVPENPVGACMVSNEGACNVFYKYGK